MCLSQNQGLNFEEVEAAYYNEQNTLLEELAKKEVP